MNKNVFSSLYAVSFDQNDPFWTQEIDLNSVVDVELLFYRFEAELVNSVSDIDLLQNRARAFVNDLILVREANPALERICQFVQFYVSCSVIRFLMGRKLLNYVYNWLCNSISEETSTNIERDYFPNRVVGFVQDRHLFIQRHFKDAFLLWTQGLFYYSRNTGGHNDLANHYLDVYFFLLQAYVREGNYNDELISAIAQVSSWCEQHKKTDILRASCSLLKEIYDNSTNDTQKKQCAFSLACLKNNYTSITRREWCDIVIDQYSQQLHAHELLQLNLNRYESDSKNIIDHFDKIREGITVYHGFLKKTLTDNIARSYELAKMYILLEKAIYRLCVDGKIDYANKLIGYFFGISEEQIISNKNFFLIPSDIDGVIFAFENDVIRHPSDTEHHIETITRAANGFLNIANTINTTLTFRITAPARLGVPDANASAAYYNALKDHIDFKKILHRKNIDEVSGFYVYYGGQLPIQSIITKETGITFPLIQSFYKPLPARVIIKAMIWQGQTNLSETEANTLKTTWESAGIEVNLLIADNSTQEDFIKNYQDNEFDIIWIICHGEFSHYEPHKSYLDLGNNIKIGLDKLKFAPAFDERRLLVLDACDGATTSLFNSPASIGIGATMTSAHQSLISHTWPINDYAGLILSIILCKKLVEGKSYNKAHEETVLLFEEGKEAVIDFVRSFCTDNDVLDRIENTSIDFKNFYYWGSLAYLE